MKTNKLFFAVVFFPSYIHGQCIGNFEIGISGPCNYIKFMNSVQERLDNPDIVSDNSIPCPHDASREIELLFPNQTIDELDKLISDSCAEAIIENTNGMLPWSDVTRNGDKFDKEYYDGNGDWNEQHQTNKPHPPYFSGQPSNVLERDAQRIDDLYEGFAQSVPIQWPGDAPTSLSNFQNCELQSVMCCWVTDRQANDNNGNCRTPYDTNCLDADPADNTEICGVSMKRSIKDGIHVDDGFVIYEGGEEGHTHCHGFAWGKDESEPDYRYRANNLFYVSMSDHLHNRGYVRAVQGSPMCSCVENMPLVTRSDCTEIQATELFKFTFSGENLVASLHYTELDFNACSAQKNNDLKSFMERLLNEGRVTREKYDKFRHTVRGINNCPFAISDILFEQDYTNAPLGDEDFTSEPGACVTHSGIDQNSGVIKLKDGGGQNSIEFGPNENKKQKCLKMCQSYSETIHVTACEAVWYQSTSGCYIHTKPVSHANGIVNHNCWVAAPFEPLELEDFTSGEPGFCVKTDGSDQNQGVVKIATGDFGPSESKKQECLDLCREYSKKSEITGCEAKWWYGNYGGCFVHKKEVFRGGGDNSYKHYCWVVKHFTPLVAENFRSEPGFCVKSNGEDQNNGVVQLATGNFGPSESKKQECFNLCINASSKLQVTGCEAVWYQNNKGCYIHTKDVYRGNGVQDHNCWVTLGPIQ